MNRGQYLVHLARTLPSLTEQPETVNSNGYDSSPPPPSLSVSIDIYSDDSRNDPSYLPDMNTIESNRLESSSTTSYPLSDLNDTNDMFCLQTTKEILDISRKPHKVNIVDNMNQQSTWLPDNIETDGKSGEQQKINIANENFLKSTPQPNNVQSAIHKTAKKRTTCKFCLTLVTNFERHLERNHTECKEVTEMLSYPKGHTERKKIIGLIRNSGHFSEYLKGNVLPKYATSGNSEDLYPCSRCKALLKRSYLSRHMKTCILKDVNKTEGRINQLAASQTLIACAIDENNTTHKLRVKDEVFCRMKADETSFTVKTDSLICNFGENYLKKHKREQLATVCSNKMRELARFLGEFRKIANNSKYSLQDILKPKFFDMAIECAKRLGGYNPENKTYRSPSLSAHIGTSLKQVCELYMRLILKEDSSVSGSINKAETLKDTKRFKELIDSQWTTEISSLAFKDLQEKQWQKPMILPLTRDVTRFKEYVTNVADKAMTTLKTDCNNKKEFKNLVHASLTLTILFNRKRIGDVQYTKLDTYIQTISSVNQEECEKALSESERALTKHYKRIVTGGKGSRPIAILFPTNLQTYIDFFIKIRSETHIVTENNPYLFGCPGTKKWTRADVVIRKFAENANLEFPGQISSNKLRKQIATVMQILNLNKEETEQFAQFMGHTEKTHNEYYKLPQDIYQTAKISKLLLLMEKGVDAYKGKSLSEIDIDPQEEAAEEELDDEESDFVFDMMSVKFSNKNKEDGVQEEVLEKRKLSKNIKGRTHWTQEQSNLVKRYFKSNITSKTVPKKGECLEIITKYPTIFYNKDWVRIKAFVYNTFRKK